MKLNVGETYNFYKNRGDFWIIKVLEVIDEKYYVEVLERIGDSEAYRKGSTGYIGFNSQMFSKYQITKYHIIGNNDSIDPEVEELIAHIQKRFEINRLETLIDEALALGNKELFIQLTNKLKGVHV